MVVDPASAALKAVGLAAAVALAVAAVAAAVEWAATGSAQVLVETEQRWSLGGIARAAEDWGMGRCCLQGSRQVQMDPTALGRSGGLVLDYRSSKKNGDREL